MKNIFFQNVRKSTKKSTVFIAAAAFALTASFTSCNKDKDVGAELSLQNETAQVISPGATATFTGAAGNISRGSGTNNKIYTVTNYFIDNGILSGTGYHIPNGYYYFDLSENDNAPVPTGSSTPTVSWDIAFGGTGNAYITVNSGVTLKAIDKAFASVVLADTSSATAISIVSGGYGHDNVLMGAWSDDDTASPGDKKGWFNYYFGNHEVVPIVGRTLIFKDAAGSIYAFEFQSVYENATPVAIPPSSYPNNYSRLHFRYKKLN